MQRDPTKDASDRPSRASDRTARVILDAAALTLARTPGVSLGRIAEAAGVGRTTLHRHFPDRAALVRALARDADEHTIRAIALSNLDEGTAVDALGRLVYELILLGDRFSFLLREPHLTDDPEVRRAEARTTGTVAEVIRRGQSDGHLRADLAPAWVAEAVGMLIYAAWIAIEGGSLPRADAHRSVLAVVLEGIRA